MKVPWIASSFDGFRPGYWLWLLGIVLYAGGVIAGGLLSKADTPAWYRSLPELHLACASSCPADELSPEAEAHLHDWASEWQRTEDECCTSRDRQQILRAALADKTAPQFPDARRLLDEEQTHFATLAAHEQHLRVSRYDVGARILFGLIDALFTLLAVRLLLRTGAVITQKHKARVFASWRAPVTAYIAIGLAVTGVTAYLAGIAASPKLSIGSDSYMVSTSAFWCTIATVVGAVVMFSIPTAMLWMLGSEDFIPAKIDPLASDGECGVGGYVSFLHAWTILAFAIALVPAVVWIRYANSWSGAPTGYLIPVSAGMAVVGAVVARLVNNAIILRKHYKAALANLGQHWSDVDAKKPAPDPTIPFIGEDWWKLPATVGALLLALWQVLEWTGASRAIVDALNS